VKNLRDKTVVRGLWIFAFFCLALAIYAGMGYAQTTASFDKASGVLTVDTAKEAVLEKFERKPITLSGAEKLDPKVPQVMKVKADTLALRFRIQTTTEIMTPAEVDEKGKVITPEKGTGTYYWQIVDGIAGQVYSDRIEITGFDGKVTKYEGNVYKMWVIARSEARR
jgi:hypothetical protein